ncbi:MAG: dual specificity protein phosphatase family protein [Phycisphaerae bacterium]
MRSMLRPLIRASFYPTLLLNRVMQWLGLWERWNWVDDVLLLGALPSRGDLARLRALGVTGVVNFCAEFGGHTRELAAAGIEQLHLKTLDYHPPSEQDMRCAIEFIARHAAAGGKVYTHCKAGRGRSATLAVCHVVWTQQLSAEQAYAAVKRARRQIDGRLARRECVKAIERRMRAGELPPPPPGRTAQ